jgi:hypothetical protein
VTFEQLIDQQRPHIEQVVADLGRKYFLAPSESDEFRRVVTLALERNDYELLRAFDGRSTWETYLNTVLTREFFAFQLTLWGEWRPSPQAERRGSVAILLEELVVRDQVAVAEAIELMRTRYRVDLTRYRIGELARELRLVSGDEQPHSATLSPALRSDPRLQTAITNAMTLFDADDRLLVELRFRDRQPMARIARLLKTSVRPLQRRVDMVKEVIRRSLLAQGIAMADVEALLRYADGEFVHPHQEWWNLVLAGPSK